MSTTELAPATRRVTRLARTNALLMMRNRLTLSYALVIPLLPLGLLFVGDQPEPVATAPTDDVPTVAITGTFASAMMSIA